MSTQNTEFEYQPRREFETWELSQSDIARLLNVTRTAVEKWQLQKTRKDGRVTLYNVKEAVDKRMANLQGDSENDGLAAARTNLAKKQAEKLDLEINMLKGKLIPIEIVIKVWADAAERFKSKQQAIPSKVSLIVAATTDPIECEEILKKANNEPLQEFQEIPEEIYIQELTKYVSDESGDSEESQNPDPKSKKKSPATVKPKRK